MIGPGWATADHPHLPGDISWLNHSQLPGEYTGVLPLGKQTYVLPQGPHWGTNRGPLAHQASALPTEPSPPCSTGVQSVCTHITDVQPVCNMCTTSVQLVCNSCSTFVTSIHKNVQLVKPGV